MPVKRPFTVPDAVTVLVACPDLFFRARILHACEAAGVPSATVAPDALATRVVAGDLAIVDLEAPGGEDAAGAAAARGARVVGFASHKDVERLRRAREAGAESLPRSAFVERLPDLVRGA